MGARRKRGKQTQDFFEYLYCQYLEEFPMTLNYRPPFLGYWVNIIPSQASVVFGLAQDPVCGLEQRACNRAQMVLAANEEVKWMTPHHGIYCTGVFFSVPLDQ